MRRDRRIDVDTTSFWCCVPAGSNLMVYSTDRSKAVVPVLVLLFFALWFIPGGDLLYVFPCVNLFLYFSVLLVMRLPRLGKRELILVPFVRLFDLCLFGFVGFLFLLGSGKGCGLWLWHSLDFSLTFFWIFVFCCFRRLHFLCCCKRNATECCNGCRWHSEHKLFILLKA